MKSLVRILLSLGALIVAYVVYMFVIAVVPGISVPAQPLKGKKRPGDLEDGVPPGDRRDVSFQVRGTTLRGWLYLPADRSVPVPCVVMALWASTGLVCI